MTGDEANPLRQIPTKYVPESDANIGALLRAARAKRGHTLEAINQHTRIPKKFLEALEGNRFEEFPASVYLRGFLKTYCDYLELEFEPLWRMIAMKESAPPAAIPEKKIPTNEASDPLHVQPKRPEPANRAPSKYPETAILLLLAVLGGAGAFWTLNLRQELKPLLPPPPPAALRPVADPLEPTLSIDFTDEAWISLSLDGQPKFEGRVPKNSRQEWKARKWIGLWTNNSQALKLTLNASPYTLPSSASGQYRIESP